MQSNTTEAYDEEAEDVPGALGGSLSQLTVPASPKPSAGASSGADIQDFTVSDDDSPVKPRVRPQPAAPAPVAKPSTSVARAGPARGLGLAGAARPGGVSPPSEDEFETVLA